MVRSRAGGARRHRPPGALADVGDGSSVCRFVFCHVDGIVVNPAMPVTRAVIDAITVRLSAGSTALIRSHDYRAGVVVGERRRENIRGGARDDNTTAARGGWEGQTSAQNVYNAPGSGNVHTAQQVRSVQGVCRLPALPRCGGRSDRGGCACSGSRA